MKDSFLTQICADYTRIHADFINKTICDHLRYICENLRLRCFLNLFCVIFFLICSISVFAQEQFVYDSKNKRDPFIPLVTPDGRLLKLEQEEAATGLLLEGIIYDKYGLSYAIVNGEVAKVGDKVGDYQVFKIEKNKVIFLKGGEPQEVELKKEEP